jgi:hydrogenase nickel incorporation protein HypA/HybF
MHELGIAASVLDTVTAAAGEARASAVCVRVGALSGVDPGALRFSIEALIAGTDMEGLKLEIDLRPRTNRCRVCGVTFEVAGYEPACPACGSLDTETIGGTELDVAWVEVEDT